MNRHLGTFLSVFLVLTYALFCTQLAASADTPRPALDSARIERVSGIKGTWNKDQTVFKLSLPRKDLEVNTAGVKMTPPLGLTAWAAFTRTGDHLMVMGDIVLLEEQVNPVMDIALANGLEVTALHNHFFWDSPKVMFMHIGGTGAEETLAAAVGKVFSKLEDTARNKPDVKRTNIDPKKSTLDAGIVQSAIGVAPETNDGVSKVTIGKSTRMHGFEMGKDMGVNTWAAFAGSNEQAIVDGDFAMLEDELQGVLKALRKSGIQIVAIHNHMTHENPRILFLHYWGAGKVADLAKGVKSALDTQK